MTPEVTLIGIRWIGVSGAKGYEIKVDGKVVATTGPKARSSRVSVSAATKIEITDLPARSFAQLVDFSQVDSA